VIISNRLRRCAALLCSVILLTPPINASTKKGDKLLKMGQKAEDQKDYLKALDYYDQALETDPREPTYIIADQRIHAKASQVLIEQGKRLQQQQKLDEVLKPERGSRSFANSSSAPWISRRISWARVKASSSTGFMLFKCAITPSASS
jgi:tetratricopeptide (TPR) repeat protein